MSGSKKSIKKLVKHNELPDNPDQITCLQVLRDSVDFMKSYENSQWRVTLPSANLARLIVGRQGPSNGHIVCSVELNKKKSPDKSEIVNRVWLALCTISLRQNPELMEQLENSVQWEWGGPEKYKRYDGPSSRNGYFYIRSHVESIEFFYTVVRPLHHAYLDKSRRHRLERNESTENPQLLKYLEHHIKPLTHVQIAGSSGTEFETPLAGDIEKPSGPDRVETTTYRILRDTKLATDIKKLHNYKCQLCGVTIALPNNNKYAEAHHIQPLGSPHDGPDVEENIICVCPNHHAVLDYFAIKLERSQITAHENIGDKYINYHNQEYARQFHP